MLPVRKGRRWTSVGGDSHAAKQVPLGCIAPHTAQRCHSEPVTDVTGVGIRFPTPQARLTFHTEQEVNYMQNKGGKRLAGGPEGDHPAKLPQDAPQPDAPQKSKARRLWDDYGYMVITLAVVFVLFRIIFQLAYVPSGSMETTLPTKSLLLGWRLPFVVSDPTPERGDIVTFYSDELGKLLVKRVIGLPGDVITVRDKRLYRNGMPVEEKYIRYEQPNIIEPIRDNFGPVTVPPDKYFVMGDNRDNSLDSRFWGFVDRGAIQAKAWRIYWSWDDKDNSPRWSRIGKAVR